MLIERHCEQNLPKTLKFSKLTKHKWNRADTRNPAGHCEYPTASVSWFFVKEQVRVGASITAFQPRPPSLVGRLLCRQLLLPPLLQLLWHVAGTGCNQEMYGKYGRRRPYPAPPQYTPGPAVQWAAPILSSEQLKGHGNEKDFLKFLEKLVPHESLTLPFEPFRFWLRICGDIHIRKTTPCYHQYGESLTPRIIDTRSRRLPASPILRVGHWIFLKKTLRIDDTESRQLPAPVIRWVSDSLYRWVGESPTPRIGDTGVAIQRKY